MNNKIEEIIFKEFQQCVYNNENQAGDKLQVIDASDLPGIITEVVKKLAMFKVIAPLSGVMRSAFMVIPDAERLDIGSNKPVAVFKNRYHADEFGKAMWEKFYIIEEVMTPHFA